MQGANDYQMPVHYELVKALGGLFAEVNWENHSQVAQKSGIHAPILYGVMGHQRGFLTHSDINAILVAAKYDGISLERYWFWEEKLHTILIKKELLATIYYDKPIRKRGQTHKDYEASLYDQEIHNLAIESGVGKDPQMIQRMAASIYALGPRNWTFVGISFGLYRLKQGIAPEHLTTPSFFEYSWHGITNLSEWLDHIDWHNLLTEQIPHQIARKFHHFWKLLGI